MVAYKRQFSLNRTSLSTFLCPTKSSISKVSGSGCGVTSRQKMPEKNSNFSQMAVTNEANDPKYLQENSWAEGVVL